MPAPTSDTDGLNSRSFSLVRTYIAYAGTVESAALRIWFRDEETGLWYAGASTDDLDPLAPGGASPVNECRDWSTGPRTDIYFQLAVVTGGGTVGVRAQGVVS